MRPTFSILLICFILGNVFAEKTLQRKIFKAVKTIRNLAETDEITNEPIPPGNYTETGDNQPESGDAGASPTKVADDKPVSSQGTQTTKKNANVQVLLFHNYGFISSINKIQFGVFLHYINYIISETAVVRLRIGYNSRLRYLDEDSVPCTCTIKDDDLVGTTGTGTNVDYNCEATPLQNGKDIANVSLNTDFDMLLSNNKGGFDALDFEGINFNGNSSEQSQNLFEQRQNVGAIGTLDGTIASTTGSTLKLVGTLNPRTLLNGISSIPLTVLTEKNGQMVNVEYECAVRRTTPDCELDCDTSSNPLNTEASNLHLSTGNTNGVGLTVYMENPYNSTRLTTTSVSRYTYPKSSSGLSGGAIAGIVIACVAVLIAASIAAIMLRKPAPIPMENTTVVGLKTVDNV